MTLNKQVGRQHPPCGDDKENEREKDEQVEPHNETEQETKYTSKTMMPHEQHYDQYSMAELHQESDTTLNGPGARCRRQHPSSRSPGSQTKHTHTYISLPIRSACLCTTSARCLPNETIASKHPTKSTTDDQTFIQQTCQICWCVLVMLMCVCGWGAVERASCNDCA